MTLGASRVGSKKYRLPRKISLKSLQSQTTLEIVPISFLFVEPTGELSVLNSPSNLIWTYNVETGRLIVEDTQGDRHENFYYRASDGHLIEEV